jgi:hypothetical protein
MTITEIGEEATWDLERLVTRMLKVSGELSRLQLMLKELDPSIAGYVQHVTTNSGGCVEPERIGDWIEILRSASLEVACRLDHNTIFIGRVE